MFAFSVSGPTIGSRLWPPLLVWKERTTVSLCASLASWLMVSPKRTPGNEVATLVIARGVPAGFKSQVPYNHYSLLHTIETAWGLAPLTANDAAATAMSDFFPGQ